MLPKAPFTTRRTLTQTPGPSRTSRSNERLKPMKTKMPSRQLACLAAWLSFVVSACGGQLYDPAADFSALNNPNGVWSYGYSLTLGGPLIPYSDALNVSGVDIWRTNISLGDPLIMHNPTTNTVTIFSTVTLGPGQLGLHPGPNDQFSVLRFAAPLSGLYQVSAMFYGQDTQGTSTDVHIIADGLYVLDGAVSGFGPGTGPSFNGIVILNAGSYLDIAVGYGSDNTFFADSTGLFLQVSVVPEPSSSLLVFLGGLFFLAFCCWKQKGKQTALKGVQP